MADVTWNDLPFDEAVSFFRKKRVIDDARYSTLTDTAKLRAFTVAGIARQDILTDVCGAMDRAISDGTTFDDFKKSVRTIMEARGWDGPAPYRLDTIFRTNIQQAYQAGHYDQMMETLDDRPYWQYVAVADGRTRPSHAAMNGTVLPHDHPFWTQNFPPNGFNCRCTVRSLNVQELKREDLRITRSDIPDISADGFGGNPEEWRRWDQRAAQYDNAPGMTIEGQKTWKDYGRLDARQVPADDRLPAPDLLQAAKTRGEAADMVATAVGIPTDSPGRIVSTPIEDLAIERRWIPHIVEKELEQRERFANYILPTIQNPYEVYETRYGDGWRRRYIGLFAGSKYDLLCVVRINQDGSVLWNVMEADDKRINKLRMGILLYGK